MSAISYGKTLQIVIFIALSVVVSSLLLLLFNVSPINGMGTMLQRGFGSYLGLGATLVLVTPLLILAVGVSIPFTAKVWNIGGQGQFVMGEVFATYVGLQLAKSGAAVLLPAAFVSAFMGGALWAIPPTVMKIRFGINEIITTVMMNFIAIYLVSYLITGPMQGAQARVFGIPSSDPIPAADFLPRILPGTNVTVGLLVGLGFIAILYVILTRSTLGYELKLVGASPDAARYAGISVRRTILLSMILSGGISGIAGMVQIFGSSGALLPQTLSDVTSSFGFVAIPVALIASLNPIAIVLSSIFFAGVLNGGYALEVAYGVPIDVITTMFGITMMFSLLGIAINFRRLAAAFRGRFGRT